MTSLNDLKALLFDDVKDYNSKKEEMSQIQTNIVLYNDLISLFNVSDIELIHNNMLAINIILECLYSKKTINAFKLEYLVYGFLRTINKEEKNSYKQQLKNILYKFKLDANIEINKYDELNNSLLSNEELIMSKKIISSLKYKQIITEKQKEFIKDRLKKENINMKDIIVILEKINIHNANITKDQNARIKYGELYSLINLLNQGYEVIELPNINNEMIDEVCNKLINSLESNSEIFEELLDNFSYYSDEIIEYIYKKVMLYYQDCMFNTIETLKDEECYFDKEIITIIKQDYYNYYVKYMTVRNKLDSLKKENDIIIDIPKEEEKIKLYYSTNNNDDPLKCWFIKDLKDVREESLSNIERYLNELKMGISNKLKPLNGHHGFSEIKDDQVRIIFRPIENDKVIVLGVFIKKDNNDREMYNKLTARSLELCSEEYNREVEEYFKNYVLENARKGTRK